MNTNKRSNPSQPEQHTPERIDQMLKAAQDSVTVIDELTGRIENGEELTEDLNNEIQRNFRHLEIVTQDQRIIDSGKDLENLKQAIQRGKDVTIDVPLFTGKGRPDNL